MRTKEEIIASTRFHGSYEGGLLEHSFKVYEIFAEKIKNVGLNTPQETIIISSLLHDICKVNFYKTDYRNAKNARGEWEKVPYYTVEDSSELDICMNNMRIEKITDYSKPEEGNKFQELAHKIYVGIYLQYYGKDTGILVCKTPKYGRTLWSEMVKIVDDR